MQSSNAPTPGSTAARDADEDLRVAVFSLEELDAMVARGDLKYLFLAPVDKEGMIAPLQKANESGLPIITVDTFIGDGDYANGPVTFPLSFIASDNKLGGVIAMFGAIITGTFRASAFCSAAATTPARRRLAASTAARSSVASLRVNAACRPNATSTTAS